MSAPPGRAAIAGGAALARTNTAVLRFAFGLTTVADHLLLAALVLFGAPLVITTVIGMLRGRFAADVVAALAIVTALVLGEHFAGAIIVLMQAGGEALESYAMSRAGASLEALLERAPKLAHRVQDGVIADIPARDVAIGDLLLVKPGDLVPVDGAVVDGSSSLDESALTGEPMPRTIGPGADVLSGALNQEGAFRLRATRPAAQSQYQQIVALVEAARAERPPIQRLADRWALWFTPLTLVMCGVAWLLTHNADSVLAVLVVATPCPLILATPVAVIAGIGRAASRGIVIRHGAAIEEAGQVRAVVFDKTGTLTLGAPGVNRVVATDGLPEGDVLRLAGAIEQLSSHHIGRALAHEAVARFGALPHPVGFVEVAGLGVSGTVEGRRVAVGSGAFIGLTRQETGRDAVPVETAAHVRIDGRYAGAVFFADRLRPEVPALMRRLASLGIRETVMLSGDRAGAAEAMARLAGISHVRAELLPAGKVEALGELRRTHAPVMMVGDGINDAPALAAASVGVAMGAHGPAAAAEAADIVLLVDDVSRVADAIEISRRTRRIALQSIGVGLGVSATLMVIASFGLIPPPLGALLQEALDAAVILNALRARAA
jgi:heavy metal translocating P-type ATPase